VCLLCRECRCRPSVGAYDEGVLGEAVAVSESGWATGDGPRTVASRSARRTMSNSARSMRWRRVTAHLVLVMLDVEPMVGVVSLHLPADHAVAGSDRGDQTSLSLPHTVKLHLISHAGICHKTARL
jgi:hypothetical protein